MRLFQLKNDEEGIAVRVSLKGIAVILMGFA
jgi:hypothetical protein